MHHNVTQKECKRCGKCCVKGGPALHTKDRGLVVSGSLMPVDLITIRRGEPVFDPLSNQVIMLEKELIKIRGKDKIGECKFFDSAVNSCLIYHKRPLECRLLKCWDTSDLENVYMKDLLSRKDLIPEGTILYKIVEKHSSIFDMCKITPFLLQQKKEAYGKTELEEIVQKEEQFRQSISQELSLNRLEMDFFFGRPIKELKLLF